MTEQDRPQGPRPGADEPPPVIDAREILGGRREVVIEHDGVRYRLRVTRRGKLTLRK